MTSDLQGKVILITGAGSGIGRATALKLHSLGAHLALTDINAANVGETHRLCASAGAGAPTTPHFCTDLDVSSSAAVARTVAAAAAHFAGRLDHVFNCAGVNPTSYALTATTDEYWDRLVDVNLKGTYLVTRAAIPFLTAAAAAAAAPETTAGSGTTTTSSIVNVSSICGVRPVAGQAIYCATKYGVIGFSKSVALELGPQGVRVNVVAPGYIDTPTNAGVVKGAEYVRRMEEGNSLGRMGTAGEVADVVAFLMGEGARYVNGSVVEVDGGLKT